MSFKAATLALAAIALKPEPYTCPVTGEKAFLKRFTVAEREQYSQKVMSAPENESNATAFTLLVCDKDGNLLYTHEDVSTVCKLPEDIVDGVLVALSKRKKTTVEQAEKN